MRETPIYPMPELITAIENVYLAFSDVPKPDSIGACSCCIDDAILDRLVSVPLRQVSGEDLSPYASSAFLTAGDVDDYLYFLPRILEVTITDDFWWPDIEVTGRAIREANLMSGQTLEEMQFRIYSKAFSKVSLPSSLTIESTNGSVVWLGPVSM